MNILSGAAAAVASMLGLLAGGCQGVRYDCYGFKAAQNFSVRLVDDAAAPVTYADPEIRLDSIALEPRSLPSCAEFDGVAVGSVIGLEHATLVSSTAGIDCSNVSADATLPSGERLESIRTFGRFDEHVFTGGGSRFNIIHRGTVGDCPGSWALGFEIGELIRKYEVRLGDVWSKDKLFDPGEPGGQAPVLAARLFQVDDGVSCAALPAGVTRCVDVYLARFEPTAP